MQLGMIGLGRMGGSMVRRVMRAGHECVGYTPSADSVRALEKEGMIGAAALSDLVAKLAEPRSVCMLVPAAAVDATLATLTPLLEPSDAAIDGENSYVPVLSAGLYSPFSARGQGDSADRLLSTLRFQFFQFGGHREQTIGVRRG